MSRRHLFLNRFLHIRCKKRGFATAGVGKGGGKCIPYYCRMYSKMVEIRWLVCAGPFCFALTIGAPNLICEKS